MTVAAGIVLAPAAFGQVELRITGATAFRSAVYDRLTNYVLNSGSTIKASGNYQTISGTFSANMGTLSGQAALIRCSFSGSAEGMRDVGSQLAIPFLNTDGTTNYTLTPDIGFSDVQPSSALAYVQPMSAFESVVRVGVVPFAWIRNVPASGALNAVTNISREQAYLLQTGTGLMPTRFLGGADDGSVVRFIGRDNMSGTRITMQRCIGFAGTPKMQDKLSGTWKATNGYSSGGSIGTALTNGTDCILSYVTLADGAARIADGKAVYLSYNGVPYSRAAVTNGYYSFWTFESAYSRQSLSAEVDKQAVYTGLLGAITNADYQLTNSIFNNYVPMGQMNVDRYQDGGLIYY